jgi:serine/threonine-protein kinase
MSVASDRNLLFGIFALQMNFISRDALIAAMNAWVLEKDKPLGQVLREQNALGGADQDFLDGVVARFLANHAGDAEKSLQALSALGAVAEALTVLPDTDVQASLRLVPASKDYPTVTGAAAATLAHGPPAAGPGTRYRVLRPHARGGLGEVFVAEDAELHRHVALKQIQAQHAQDAASRERFILEAEITGGLEHPGIVPVYGLGAHPDGRPYYAMRFIKGDSLRDAIERFHREEGGHATARNVEFRALLGRFIALCNAVAYAHSRGVIHRDLKPANVMLGKFGETLVVDWGLAKTVGRGGDGEPHPPADEATLHVHSSGSTATQTGAILGTPAFMSPEQAAGQADLSPASDVYSLGATLYALLTGRAPFDGPAPAVVADVQQGAFLPPRQVKADVPRPLEAVCLRAMALRLADRYPSAAALAADVEHWLADEPVSAYAEPLTVRLRRWARRHRTFVTGLAALVLTATAALAVGFVVVSGQKARVERAESDARAALEVSRAAEKEAKEQRRLAEKAEADARTALEVSQAAEKDAKEQRQLADEQRRLALNTLRSVVNDGDAQLKDKPALQHLRKKLLKTAADGLKQVARSAETAGQIDHATIGVHIELGDISLRTDGATAEARTQYELAHALAARRAEAERDNPEAQRDLAGSLNKLGDVQRQMGEPKAALASYTRSREINQRLVDADPKSAQAQRDLSVSIYKVGDAQRQLGDTKAALVSYTRSLALNQKLADDDPNSAEAQRQLSISLNKVGDVHRQLNETNVALAHYERSLAISEKLADTDPQSAQAQRDLSVSLDKLGYAQLKLGDTRAALASYQRSLDISRKFADADPGNAQAQRDVSVSLDKIGDVQQKLGDTQAALASYQRSLEISERLADADRGNAEAQTDLGISYYKLGVLEKSRFNYPGAAGWFGKGKAVFLALREAGKLSDQFKNSVTLMETEIAFCAAAEKANDDLHFALKQPAEKVPALLAARCAYWHHKGKHAEVVATADRLRALADAADAPVGGNLFLAARGYALAADCADADAPTKESHAARAVALLGDARDKGYFKAKARLDEAQNDVGLQALRVRDDFKALWAELEKDAK